MNFFDRAAEESGGAERMVLTVLEGESLGEQCLLEGEKIVWMSHKDGFFSRHREELCPPFSFGKEKIGGIQIFCDCILRENKMILCGAGHVSLAVIRMAKLLGFSVTVLEDRPSFADQAREAGADQVICAPFAESLRQMPGGEGVSFVVVTRGHRYDQICLKEILKKQYDYVGMMGSRRRAAAVKESLQAEGFSETQLHGLHSPIGLKIGAETPEEIALSILAEIVEEKNKKGKRGGYDPRLVENLKEPGEKILAVIVDRKGSAPRAAGTKMAVFPDGRISGTIGGGCMEAEVIRTALSMLRGGKEEARLLEVELTAQAGEEEGMVCGGKIEVLLERIR